MKRFQLVIDLLKNKYVVALLGFTIWILFFDRNDFFTQWDRKVELKKLEQSKEYYVSEIATIKRDLDDLQSNTSVLEKFARENFFLKRLNEDVFIVEDIEKEKTEGVKQ